MKSMVLLLMFFLLVAPILACASKSTPIEKPESMKPSVKETQVRGKEPWQVEWEKAIKLGQREGKFVAHTSYSSEVTRALMAAFKENYGIGAEFISGRGAELRARFFSERRAGLYLVDLVFRGASGITADQKPAGALEPLEPLLILPEVLDPKVWWGGKLNWVDDEHFIYTYLAYPSGQLAINTGVVNLEEIKSWHDLLASKWKGKVSINDPTTTGSGNAWFHAMGKEILGLDYMRELVKQEPVLLRDLSLQGQWLATGKYPLAIGSTGNVIPELVRAGVPIVEKMLAEGGYITAGSGSIALVNGAPHPNAARVFVNWVLTREAQTIITKIYRGQSARIDVPMDFLPPELVRQDGVKYADSRSEKAQLGQVQWTQVAKEVFGPLIR